MSMPDPYSPCVQVDGAVVLPLCHVADPDLVSVFDPPVASGSGLVVSRCVGPVLAERLDSLGHTPARAKTALAGSIGLVREAQNGLPAHTQSRLAWPTLAASIDAAGWLRAYSMWGPESWLLDLAGALDSAALLRCCLLARPDAEVALWLEPRAVPSGEVRGGELVPAPMRAASARELLLFDQAAKPRQQPGQQP